MPPKGKGRGKAAAGHRHASTLPKGTEMVDLRKKSWFLGEPIGSGGFGLIYLADDDNKNTLAKDKAKFVIKVEPKGNGPLFCEIAFYQRVATSDAIASWKKTSRLPYVGIPAFVSHGLHTNGKEDLRFLVMPRFGCDLHNLWLKANKRFKRDTVCQVAISLINSLEYLHSMKYVHADVKGANILLGHENANQVYLVDFGLVCRYTFGEKHREYKEEPAKAHDGTIEYTSRDAHLGVAPSRRSDLEILGYVLLHWLSGRLPWDDNLANKTYVKGQKIKHMAKIKEFVASVYPEAKSNKEIEKYLQTVSNLEYEEQPDYDLLRKYFHDALKSMGVNSKAKLSFEGNDAPTPVKNRPVDQPRTNASTPAKKRRVNRPQTKPLASTTNSQSCPSDEEELGSIENSKRSRMKVNSKRTRTKVKSSTEEDKFGMDSAATSEETLMKTSRLPESRPSVSKTNLRKRKAPKKPLTSASDSQSSQSDEDEFLPRKDLKRTLKKRRVTSSSEDTSINTTASEATPVKTASSAKKPVRKKATQSKGKHKRKIESADSSVAEHSTAENVVRAAENIVMIPKKKIVGSAKKERTPPKLDEASPSAATNGKVANSAFASPRSRPRKVTKSCDVKNGPPVTHENAPAKSRYSMGPLHTQSVLAKHDKLTGKTSGKHPVIIRRRKVKRPRSDAETQTTPSLSKRVSRI